MSLALYRKYRPGSFGEVMGQAHVTGPLQQALTNGRFSHAYLFSGPRGCGKTSSARIMARSLNCEHGPTPTPCGVCDSCVALAPNGPGSLDVIEIDAASHGGVEDARDLRERAFFAPVSSRFKVYIIDEAHMVTSGGFNALLKLVEEPPEFVKFIFATTEPDKVLQTIRSRTHHYPFRLMPPRDLTALLSKVVEQEGIAVDQTVLPLVVRAAAGSARDGLSILDQVMASSGADGVTREVAAALLGVTPDTLLDGIVDAFAAHDAKAVYGLLDQVMEGGHDPRRFVTDVLERLRDLIILDAVPDAGASGLLDCPDDQLERMGRQAVAMGTAGLSRAADLFHAGLTEMRGNAAPGCCSSCCAHGCSCPLRGSATGLLPSAWNGSNDAWTSPAVRGERRGSLQGRRRPGRHRSRLARSRRVRRRPPTRRPVESRPPPPGQQARCRPSARPSVPPRTRPVRSPSARRRPACARRGMRQLVPEPHPRRRTVRQRGQARRPPMPGRPRRPRAGAGRSARAGSPSARAGGPTGAGPAVGHRQRGAAGLLGPGARGREVPKAHRPRPTG